MIAVQVDSEPDCYTDFVFDLIRAEIWPVFNSAE